MDILNWEERPFVPLEHMANYSARDAVTAQRYGPVVKAAAISNRDYGYRFAKYHAGRTMRPPPSSHIHIHIGVLVVRNLGTAKQCETWMPTDAFDELYVAAGEI